MVEFERCWACDRLASSKEQSGFARIEKHHIFGHIFGKGNSNETLNLCVICHDMVDRSNLDNTEIFTEFFKLNDEFKEMPRGKYPITKLFFLKIIKIMQNLKEERNAKTTASEG